MIRRVATRRSLALALSFAGATLGGATLGACAAATGGVATGAAVPPAPRSRADVWITIRDFRMVGAVAASERTVYLGSTAGLERWDSLRETWLAPITSADGLPDDRITAIAAERFGGDVWIGTRHGLARLAFDDVVEAVWGPPAGPVDAILLDPRDGSVHALVAGSWWNGRGGSLEREGGPPTGQLEGSMRASDLDPGEVPWFDPIYVRSAAFSDVFRLTEVDRDATGDWYAGTWGDNGRRWRAGSADWEPLYFGLAGDGGGPVVRASDGLWLVPGGGDRGALAHASSDLVAWSYVAPRVLPALPSAVWRAAIALGDTLLLAGDLGIAWGVGPGWANAGRDGDVGPALALAADGPILWVGTERGLVAWDRALGRPAAWVLEGRRVAAIAVAPDAIFAGGDGLWAARRAGPLLSAADAAAVLDSLAPVEPAGRDVRALALHGATLLVASDRGLETFDRVTGAWRTFAAGAGGLDDAPIAIAVDGENVWVGTKSGLARWRPATGEWRSYGASDGLAGAPVLHLLAERDQLWISTPAGVTRFAWRAEEP